MQKGLVGHRIHAKRVCIRWGQGRLAKKGATSTDGAQEHVAIEADDRIELSNALKHDGHKQLQSPGSGPGADACQSKVTVSSSITVTAK